MSSIALDTYVLRSELLDCCDGQQRAAVVEELLECTGKLFLDLPFDRVGQRWKTVSYEAYQVYVRNVVELRTNLAG